MIVFIPNLSSQVELVTFSLVEYNMLLILFQVMIGLVIIVLVGVEIGLTRFLLTLCLDGIVSISSIVLFTILLSRLSHVYT